MLVIPGTIASKVTLIKVARAFGFNEEFSQNICDLNSLKIYFKEYFKRLKKHIQAFLD